MTDEGRRRLHVASEIVALTAVVPFTVWIATRSRPLTGGEKGLLWATAIGAVVIDGVLLSSYLRGRT